MAYNYEDNAWDAVYNTQDVYMDFMGESYDTYGEDQELREIYEAYKAGIRVPDEEALAAGSSVPPPPAWMWMVPGAVVAYYLAQGVEYVEGQFAYEYDYGGTEGLSYEEWAEEFADEEQWMKDWENTLEDDVDKIEYDFGSEEFLEGQTMLGNEARVSSAIKGKAELEQINAKTGFTDSYITKDFTDTMFRRLSRDSDRSFKNLQRSKTKMREDWLVGVYDHAKVLVSGGMVDKPYREYSDIMEDRHWSADVAEWYDEAYDKTFGWAEDMQAKDQPKWKQRLGAMVDVVAPDSILGGVDVSTEIMDMQDNFEDAEWLSERGFKSEGEARDAWDAFLESGGLRPASDFETQEEYEYYVERYGPDVLGYEVEETFDEWVFEGLLGQEDTPEFDIFEVLNPFPEEIGSPDEFRELSENAWGD